MKKSHLTLPVLLLLLTGCQHYYYLPNSLNMPAMSQQHDASVMLATGKSNCKQVQLSYSPLKYVGLMYNGMKVRDGNTTGGMQEGGLGFYYALDKDITFGLFGGWGQGREHHAYTISNYNSNTYYTTNQEIYANLSFQRKFIQPYLSYQGKWLQIGAGLRFASLSFTSGDIDIRITQNSEDKFALEYLEQKSPFHLAEAGCSIGVRVHALTLGMQYAYLNDTALQHSIFVHTNLSFSAAIQLNDFWRPRWHLSDDSK